ncbi:hypothetical protein PUNSTDRAFT_51779, partial [Punctularia strigosozonata HHB-11173 SS5]|uniref:uncharacterized protein n=1 Tax=Punctularia strigosozonata (strain HHB-11173) TaxID=741275 RepID=UPI00044186E3
MGSHPAYFPWKSYPQPSSSKVSRTRVLSPIPTAHLDARRILSLLTHVQLRLRVPRGRDRIEHALSSSHRCSRM